jgi:recombination protein RecR
MLPEPINNVAYNFQKFPGIGFKSSQKLALDILQMKDDDYQQFLESVDRIKKEVRLCSQCGFFAQQQEGVKEEECLCEICKNDGRNNYQICIVEKATDVITMEKSGIFNGRYQILENLISPLENIFPEDTKVSYFIQQRLPGLLKEYESSKKMKTPNQFELILFFKAGFASEATTAYLKEVLEQRKLLDIIKITRLAQGLPLYYNPDTLDQATMAKALEDRREIN